MKFSFKKRDSGIIDFYYGSRLVQTIHNGYNPELICEIANKATELSGYELSIVTDLLFSLK